MKVYFLNPPADGGLNLVREGPLHAAYFDVDGGLGSHLPGDGGGGAAR